MATGTVAAVTWAAPPASPAQAVDMLSVHSLTRAQHAEPARLTAQDSLARQAILNRAAALNAAARAAERAAASRAAARAAAERAAAQRAAERAAAERAAAERAAAERAAAERAATQRAAAKQAATEEVARRVPAGTSQQIAEQMLAQYGWAGQFYCLDSLWERESGWNVYAENPGSGAYGIPQALPASKMAAAGSDWLSDAATQISWGLGYIRAAYGSPCAAWDHEEAAAWY